MGSPPHHLTRFGMYPAKPDHPNNNVTQRTTAGDLIEGNTAGLRANIPTDAGDATTTGTTDKIAPKVSIPVSDPTIKPPVPLPVNTSTPVNIAYFAKCLRNYPDQDMVEYLVSGLTHGFHIGLDENDLPKSPHPQNHKSARDHPDDVTKAINKELSHGHMAGPFSEPPFADLHCSPLGAREKDDGSYRLIMDLSYPKGGSINDFISKEDFSVHYTKFDEATRLVRQRGRNCLMFKMDIKHAFRVLPIHPSQWKYLGTKWMGFYFVDFRFPFGLRSSPGVFTRFADAVCWIIQNIYHLPYSIHYSDDFLIITLHADSSDNDFERATQAFKDLGIPVASDKTVGPTTSLVYLGVSIDSMLLTMSVPDRKVEELLTLLDTWCSRRRCTKTELLSLTGKLSDICKVVEPGRIFVRRLFDLASTVTSGHHHLHLNTEAREDILWWSNFLPTWKRTTIIPQTYELRDSDICLSTDASKIGLGGVFGNHWIQHPWPKTMNALTVGKAIDIDYLELFAIYAACATWGTQWASNRIVVCTDNRPIIDVWRAGTSKSKSLMSLVRLIFMEAAKHQYRLALKFVPGKTNVHADLISRFQMNRFFTTHPLADRHPTPLPDRVIQLLL